MSASVCPRGDPWLCHPNLSSSLEVPALPHNLTTQRVPCLLPRGPWHCLPPSKTQWMPQLIPGVAWWLGSAPQPRYFGWYLGGVWVPPGPLGRCGVVWRCHLGVLLTAVLRGGRRRAGGGPGLHPKAAVVGAARAAPAKGREPIGELRHRKGASPVPTSTLLHPYLWG